MPVAITGLVIPIILWFFNSGGKDRVDRLKTLAEAEAAAVTTPLKHLIVVQVREEQRKSSVPRTWGYAAAYLVGGVVLGYAILWLQNWSIINNLLPAGPLKDGAVGGAIGMAFFTAGALLAARHIVRRPANK